MEEGAPNTLPPTVAPNTGADPNVGAAPKAVVAPPPNIDVAGLSGLLNDENRPPPELGAADCPNTLPPPPPPPKTLVCGEVGLFAVNVGVFRIPPVAGVVVTVPPPNIEVAGLGAEEAAVAAAPNGEPNTFLGGSFGFKGLAEPRPPNVRPLVMLFVDDSMSASISFVLLVRFKSRDKYFFSSSNFV